MSRSALTAVAVSICVAFSAIFALGAPSASAADPPWAQAKSDIPPDPAVRFGILPNGMRYAVMKNATPAGQTSIRLRIGSGSLEERDDQQGLAHVLEHMSFKGSIHVPPGEMLKILERNGLAFGPDTNAETGWTQTVYQLDLPRSDKSLIDTGLMLMRETGGNLLIEPSQLASERGVVLSEERLRDTPQYRAMKAEIDLLDHGQRVTERFPIGKVDVVKTAPASLIREFYRANYRPDRATLIVVGNFDPAMVEAMIKARFSNWRPVGPETPEPDLGHVEKRGLTVSVVNLPGAQTLTYIAWARPYDTSPDTAAKHRREIIENLALAVLNRRLTRLAVGDDPPFIQSESGFQDVLHSSKVAVIDATSRPDAWKPALTAIEQSVRRLTTFGVSKAEIDEEIAESRATLVNALAGAATRPTPELANGLVESVDGDEVFTSPAEDLALFDAATKGVAPDDVDAAARRIFAGAGPLVELESPTPVEGGEEAVSKVYAASAAVPVVAPAAEAAVVWPYASFGTLGQVKSRREIADLGATQVRFENGVALTVKPTDFRKDQVLISVDMGHGRKDLPRDRPDIAWAANVLVQGGFEALSQEDAQRALAGKIYDAQASVSDDALLLRGITRPKDLATQMQVLAAYVAHPGFRPAAFERLRESWLQALPQLAATPEGVERLDLEKLLHNGDPRWEVPTAAQIRAAKLDDLKALLKDPLEKAPIEITIVGDVTVDEAIKEVAATFGALPARPERTPIAENDAVASFPAPTAAPIVLADSGRADQAMAFVAWPVTDFYENTRDSRAAMLAGEVFGNLVIDQVRVAEGATYSPEVQVSLSESFPRYGVAIAAVEIPPQKIPGFYADIAAITAKMRTSGVTADELERARNPRVAGLKKAMETNEYWLLRLEGSIADPRRLDIIRTTLPDYAKVTAADLQAAARRYFVDDRAWKLEIKPSAAP
ncbi:MAG TPA: insulinase family protein [Caulobacteraceae bacterium]|jgi:zinc protease